MLSAADMDYMTLKEADGKRGISSPQVNYYCVEGRIHGAVKMAGVWLVPKGAENRRIDDIRKVGKTMLHIAICDDERGFVQHLAELLNQYSKETGRDIKITAYYDGMELIEKYDTTIDLIFLDIQMRLVNGLRAAERIRQMDENVGIIFLTTLTQYGLEGYKYQAINYIIKPIKYVRLKSELDKFVGRSQKEEIPSLVIANDTGKYKVPLRSIRYIETYNRNLMFHTEQENIICYKSMKEMERELCGKDFVRCHTSYIVNLFYVKGIKKLEIELITGEIIPISQPKRKDFMERLTEYWGDFL